MGDDIKVAGPASTAIQNGSGNWTIASGAQITLSDGQAELKLLEGGELDFSAPAHLTMLKSSGVVIVALDYGLVRMRLDGLTPLTVYTPLIVATPMPIGNGMRNVTVGLNQEGEMCALAETGATRITQQFSTQGIVVPQGAGINLTGGQLDPPGTGTLDCHFPPPISRKSASGSPLNAAESQAAQPSAATAPANASAGADAPLRDLSSVPSDGKLDVHVEMPPLSFDAASASTGDPVKAAQPVSPPPAPDRAPSATTAPANQTNQRSTAAIMVPASSDPSQQAPVPKRHRNIFARMFGFLHRHKPSPPCEGDGCSAQS